MQCNVCRLENHSVTHSCMIHWTIIKPIEDHAAAGEDLTLQESLQV